MKEKISSKCLPACSPTSLNSEGQSPLSSGRRSPDYSCPPPTVPSLTQRNATFQSPLEQEVQELFGAFEKYILTNSADARIFFQKAQELQHLPFDLNDLRPHVSDLIHKKIQAYSPDDQPKVIAILADVLCQLFQQDLCNLSMPAPCDNAWCIRFILSVSFTQLAINYFTELPFSDQLKLAQAIGSLGFLHPFKAFLVCLYELAQLPHEKLASAAITTWVPATTQLHASSLFQEKRSASEIKAALLSEIQKLQLPSHTQHSLQNLLGN